nr:PREDICTED: uncharacterized protein LOC109041652 [Bemisia tabaci]
MDVHYNNIFESTRQYFQGVPVNDVSNKSESEQESDIEKQKISNLKHAKYMSAPSPSTSRAYWMPQNEGPGHNKVPFRQNAHAAVAEDETHQKHHNNLLPPIAALSSTGVSNFPAFKAVDKMSHLGQYHGNSSSRTTDYAPSSVAAPAPYYSISSQVAVTSSPAYYYPANVQASTSKSAPYLHHANDTSIVSLKRTPLSGSRESSSSSSSMASIFPTKSSSYRMNPKKDIKPPFSSSSASMFPPHSGFQLPVAPFKQGLPYLSTAESLQFGSKIMHPPRNGNNSLSKGNSNMGVSSFSSNQIMYGLNSASSKSNSVSHQSEMTKRESLHQASHPISGAPKLKANTGSIAASSHAASVHTPVSVFGYSVPKIQPTDFHQSMIQINPKLRPDISRDNASPLNRTQSGLPHAQHGTSKKLPSFPETSLYPVVQEKKSVPTALHYPGISPVSNERSKVIQHPQTTRVVNQDLEAWTPKNSGRLKRESPLDLSVKTVRQSADSTAKDEYENNSSFSLPGFQTLDFRIRPQMSEPFAPVSVPGLGYPLNNPQSSIPALSASASELSRRNANSIFSVPHHIQPQRERAAAEEENNDWRSNESDQGMMQHRTHARSSSELHKSGQRSQPYEPIVNAPPRLQYYEQRHLSAQLLERSAQSRNIINQHYSIPQSHFALANPVDNSVYNSSKANMFSHSKSAQSNSSESHHSKKRPLHAQSGSEHKAKSPKVDAWLKTIDQQIEEKFSSYVTSKANDHRSSTPITSASDPNVRPAVDGSSQNFSRNHAHIRYTPYTEEKVYQEIKAPEESKAYSKRDERFINVTESSPSLFTREQVNHCSVVRHSDSINANIMTPADITAASRGTTSEIVAEKFDGSSTPQPQLVSPLVSFKGKEDEEKIMPRPRTKAELKQVESSRNFPKSDFNVGNDNLSTSNCKMTFLQNSTPSFAGDVESGESKSGDGLPTPPSESSVSPPKLTEEEISRLPRKKLSSEMDESEDGRCSLDPCVFDFRDSDSECEMPVLERQTLDEMRRERDRRIHSKISTSNENLSSEKVATSETSVVEESKDPFWMETCDSFLEQLTTAPVQKLKKISRKHLKHDSKSSDSALDKKSSNDIMESSNDIEHSIIDKIREQILLRDSRVKRGELWDPKVVVKDFKKEKQHFPNLKLEKLSTVELKQEIAELKSMKKELQEKILESSFNDEKTEPLDELKPNRLHLKKLKSRQKSIKPKETGNQENIKRSVNIKIKKHKHLRKLTSSDVEQSTSSKQESKDSLSSPSRSSDSSISRIEPSTSRKRKQNEIMPNSLSSRFVLSEAKSNGRPKLILKSTNRKDSSESVSSNDLEVNSQRNKSLPRRSGNELPLKNSAINERSKRKILKRRRVSCSIGGRPGLRSATGLRSAKSMLNVKRQKQLKNKMKNKNTKSAKQPEIAKPQVDKDEKDVGSDHTEAVHLNKKKFKFRTVRRKFRSSGFDYLRKKKKQMKKQAACDETKLKKFSTIRATPESIHDLQAEIKSWVINKGLGESVLHRAARLGYPDAVAYCLEVLEIGASVRDNAGYTPLHEASHRGHLAIARMLLMYGADSSASAIGGIRPLHEAAENGHVELVRLLLSYGADPLLATYSGQTPISLAHDVAMRNLLEHHLADVQGSTAPKWDLNTWPSFYDDAMFGCAVLSDAPDISPRHEPDVEIEYSENNLPSTFWLIGEPMSDVWAMWHEVASVLRVKSTDALLKLLGKTSAEILRELTPAEFTSKASNPSIFGAASYKSQSKCQKILLVKYTEQLRSHMNIEKLTVSLR